MRIIYEVLFMISFSACLSPNLVTRVKYECVLYVNNHSIYIYMRVFVCSNKLTSCFELSF